MFWTAKATAIVFNQSNQYFTPAETQLNHKNTLTDGYIVYTLEA